MQELVHIKTVTVIPCEIFMCAFKSDQGNISVESFMQESLKSGMKVFFLIRKQKQHVDLV